MNQHLVVDYLVLELAQLLLQVAKVALVVGSQPLAIFADRAEDALVLALQGHNATILIFEELLVLELDVGHLDHALVALYRLNQLLVEVLDGGGQPRKTLLEPRALLLDKCQLSLDLE